MLFVLLTTYSFILGRCSLWHHSKKLAASTFLRSRTLCLAKRFIITCLWPHPRQPRPMNTDSILQKQRLGTTQTDRVGGEGGWPAQCPSLGEALGQPVGELGWPGFQSGLQPETLTFCFLGCEAPLGRRRNTQPIVWHFIYITSLVELFWRTRGGRGIPSLYALGYSLKSE